MTLPSRRTIPTRVGRTFNGLRTSTLATDHPHAGGENDGQIRSGHLWSGPSPRGWGERVARTRKQPNARTIPTRVGRTAEDLTHVTCDSDHPHAGGENAATAASTPFSSGPSPRGWGEPTVALLTGHLRGTIPTRVGRTSPPLSPHEPHSDHPHAGGENPDPGPRSSPRSGPSPRGWGERGRGSLQAHGGRTIPTRVGRTRSLSPPVLPSPDHPHAGGENESRHRAPNSRPGPSPRGWGERPLFNLDRQHPRTIPTRVGRTKTARSKSWARSDHPHAGGENYQPKRQTFRRIGPSPRGWGELPKQNASTYIFRTIPTRVGRTYSR